jgi:hypothetical protein
MNTIGPDHRIGGHARTVGKRQPDTFAGLI